MTATNGQRTPLLDYATKQRAKVALLLDHFKLTLDHYARLTDRQIDDLYFHARNMRGEIDTSSPIRAADQEEPTGEPEPAWTLESELAALDKVASISHVNAAQLEDLKAKLRAKYGRDS